MMNILQMVYTFYAICLLDAVAFKKIFFMVPSSMGLLFFFFWVEMVFSQNAYYMGDFLFK